MLDSHCFSISVRQFTILLQHCVLIASSVWYDISSSTPMSYHLALAGNMAVRTARRSHGPRCPVPIRKYMYVYMTPEK